MFISYCILIFYAYIITILSPKLSGSDTAFCPVLGQALLMEVHDGYSFLLFTWNKTVKHFSFYLIALFSGIGRININVVYMQ